MSWFKTNNLAAVKAGAWSLALLVVLTMSLALPRSGAQVMQKGIRVELAATNSAAPVPDADNQDALIITVTDTGKLYLGIDPVTPDALAEKLGGRISRTQNLYIKADAKAPYASVVRILDAAHATGLTNIALLTTQGKPSQPGKLAVPEGIKMKLARRTSAATE
jgi:biopolymer transport protein ExbD